VAPAVSGTTIQGSTLSVTNGTWLNSPVSYAYQWKRNGTAISGATSSTYVLVGADVSDNISCDVTATNTGGSNTALSNSVGPISATPTLSAPVLTKTSSAGTNPPTWDATMADLQDGDTIELYYTEDGTTPTATGSPQGTHIANGVEENVNWGSAWPNPFPGGITVKWAERYGRIIGGTMVWSPLSNVLSDTMPSAGGVLTPISATPAAQTNSATSHTFPSVALGAGKPVIAIAAYFVSSVVLRPTGTTGASDITLTLIADVDASRRDATVWWSSTAISAGNYDIIINHSSANSDCSVFGWTATGVTTAGSSFGQAFGVSSSDYAGTVPALASGAVYAAVAHAYANSTMNWSGAAAPTKDTELQYGSTMSAAHGSTAGAIHCAPSPGGGGAMAGVVLNP
jgi:hypothetical protein